MHNIHYLLAITLTMLRACSTHMISIDYDTYMQNQASYKNEDIIITAEIGQVLDNYEVFEGKRIEINALITHFEERDSMVCSKDGKILREEQSGDFTPVEAGIPDMNPMGCQKGACWSHCHYSPDRVLYPMKRVGERGKGQFERVSWDEAMADIARAILDAIQEQGGESVLTLLTPEVGAIPARQLSVLLGTPMTDGIAEFQDFSPGWHITWGLFNPTSSMDDWFLAELTLIWHANPVYTNIQWYHYVAESRYNGGEVVTIAGTGHFPTMEKPEACVEAILEFLRRRIKKKP